MKITLTLPANLQSAIGVPVEWEFTDDMWSKRIALFTDQVEAQKALFGFHETHAQKMADFGSQGEAIGKMLGEHADLFEEYILKGRDNLKEEQKAIIDDLKKRIPNYETFEADARKVIEGVKKLAEDGQPILERTEKVDSAISDFVYAGIKNPAVRKALEPHKEEVVALLSHLFVEEKLKMVGKAMQAEVETLEATLRSSAQLNERYAHLVATAASEGVNAAVFGRADMVAEPKLAEKLTPHTLDVVKQRLDVPHSSGIEDAIGAYVKAALAKSQEIDFKAIAGHLSKLPDQTSDISHMLPKDEAEVKKIAEAYQAEVKRLKEIADTASTVSSAAEDAASKGAGDSRTWFQKLYKTADGKEVSTPKAAGWVAAGLVAAYAIKKAMEPDEPQDWKTRTQQAQGTATPIR